MNAYGLNFMCMTDSGVSFPVAVVVPAALDPDDAQVKAQEQLAKGTTITLMFGGPPMPVMVAAAIMTQCTPLKQTISIATSMPKSGTTH